MTKLSLVIMLKSFRILLSITRNYDTTKYGKWMLRLLLNEYFKESIYMSQPKKFIKQGQEHKVCKP